MKKFSIALVLSVFFSAVVVAQEINTVKLDSFFNILASNNKGMGSISINRNGRMLYQKSMGFSFIADNFRKYADAGTKYRIGSVTKMFTATMIFQMIEEKKLNLSTRLDSFFSDLPNAKNISISMLLNHRSGLHDFVTDADYLSWHGNPKTRNELFAYIKRTPVDFQPGVLAAYSNANYIILGAIVEVLDEKTYEKALFDRITSKINIRNTYVGAGTDTIRNESFSFKYANLWIQEESTDMSIPGGAGSIVSTSADLSLFINSLFTGKLVNASSLGQMMIIVDGFGMGMVRYPFHDRVAYGHTGGIDGFSSMVFHIPQDSLSVAYVSNGTSYPINDIMIAALNVYYKRPFNIPTFSTLYYKSEDLDKYIGTYSSLQLPMKITITKDSSTLIAQASGQAAFYMESTVLHIFEYHMAGIRIVFNPDRKELILKQGGQNFLFSKER